MKPFIGLWEFFLEGGDAFMEGADPAVSFHEVLCRVNPPLDETHHVFKDKARESWPGAKPLNILNSVVQVVDVHGHVSFTRSFDNLWSKSSIFDQLWQKKISNGEFWWKKIQKMKNLLDERSFSISFDEINWTMSSTNLFQRSLTLWGRNFVSTGKEK